MHTAFNYYRRKHIAVPIYSYIYTAREISTNGTIDTATQKMKFYISTNRAQLEEPDINHRTNGERKRTWWLNISWILTKASQQQREQRQGKCRERLINRHLVTHLQSNYMLENKPALWRALPGASLVRENSIYFIALGRKATLPRSFFNFEPSDTVDVAVIAAVAYKSITI